MKIDASLGDAAFTVGTLAEAMHLSPRQLHRKVMALAGESPSQRLRRVRLEQAQSMLKAETLSIKEVGFSVGFKNESAFSRAYAKHFGVPPSSHV